MTPLFQTWSRILFPLILPLGKKTGILTLSKKLWTSKIKTKLAKISLVFKIKTYRTQCNYQNFLGLARPALSSRMRVGILTKAKNWRPLGNIEIWRGKNSNWSRFTVIGVIPLLSLDSNPAFRLSNSKVNFKIFFMHMKNKSIWIVQATHPIHINLSQKDHKSLKPHGHESHFQSRFLCYFFFQKRYYCNCYPQHIQTLFFSVLILPILINKIVLTFLITLTNLIILITLTNLIVLHYTFQSNFQVTLAIFQKWVPN